MALPEGSGVFLSHNSEGGAGWGSQCQLRRGTAGLAWGSVLGTQLARCRPRAPGSGAPQGPRPADVSLRSKAQDPRGRRCSLAWPRSTPHPPAWAGPPCQSGHHLLTLLSGSHQGRSGPLIGSHHIGVGGAGRAQAPPDSGFSGGRYVPPPGVRSPLVGVGRPGLLPRSVLWPAANCGR